MIRAREPAKNMQSYHVGTIHLFNEYLSGWVEGLVMGGKDMSKLHHSLNKVSHDIRNGGGMEGKDMSKLHHSLNMASVA
jgi:hypothetical protein